MKTPLLLLALAVSQQTQPIELNHCRQVMDVLNETANAGIITQMQADAGSKRCLETAEKTLGRKIGAEELLTLSIAAPTGNIDNKLVSGRQTTLQKLAGLVTFTNVLWLMAIVFGVGCLTYLLWDIIKNIPPQLYEALLYLVSAAFIVLGAVAAGPDTREYIGATGCLLFAGAIALTWNLHKIKSGATGAFGIIATVAAIAAIWYGSSIIGFIAVLALLCALGFFAGTEPLTYVIGFKDDTALGRATVAAFLMLFGFVGIRLWGSNVPALAPFERGALFLGSFVGYLGLLIASSRWYHKRQLYPIMQIITIGAGLAALGVGSIFGIGELQKIGGTFFVLYLIEKPAEIPAQSARGYAAVGLFVSIVAYGVCMYIKTHIGNLEQYVMFVS